jgi:hypothetical protein
MGSYVEWPVDGRPSRLIASTHALHVDSGAGGRGVVKRHDT